MAAQGRRLVYESGEWEIDLARRELRARGTPVPIGGRAFDAIHGSSPLRKVGVGYWEHFSL